MPILGCKNSIVPTKLHGNFNSYDSTEVLEGFEYSLVAIVEKEKTKNSPWYKEEAYNIKVQGYEEYQLRFYNNQLYSIFLRPKNMKECKKILPSKNKKIIVKSGFCIVMDIILNKEITTYIWNHA